VPSKHDRWNVRRSYVSGARLLPVDYRGWWTVQGALQREPGRGWGLESSSRRFLTCLMFCGARMAAGRHAALPNPGPGRGISTIAARVTYMIRILSSQVRTLCRLYCQIRRLTATHESHKLTRCPPDRASFPKTSYTTKTLSLQHTHSSKLPRVTSSCPDNTTSCTPALAAEPDTTLT
jgi:hypothetical protein